VAISDDGRSVVAIGADGLACWDWDRDEPPRLRRVEAGAQGHEVLLSPTGTVFALGDRGMVFDLDADVWEDDAVVSVTAAAITGPSEIVYVDDDGEIVRHDLVTSHREPIGATKQRRDAWSIAGFDGGVVALTLVDRARLKVFGYPGKEYALRALQHPITAFAVSPDGWHVAAGTDGGWLAVARLQEHVMWAYTGPLRSEVTAVALAGGGSLVATGCEDGTVTVFGSDGTSLGTVSVSHRPIRKVVLCRDTIRGAALDADGNAHWFAFDAGAATTCAAAQLPAISRGPAGSRAVTAFLAGQGQVMAAMSDGALFLAAIGTCEPRKSLRLDVVARRLGSVDIGGREGVLIDTGAGYHLLHGHFDRAIDLGSAEWVGQHLSSRVPASRIGVGSDLVEVRHDSFYLWVTKLGADSAPGTEPDDHMGVELGVHEGCEVVRTAYFGGRPLAFSGGSDGCVDVWDLESLQMIDTMAVGGPVRDLRTVDGRYLLVLVGGELLAFEHFDGSGKGS
jgi:hypothetical protein